MEAEQTVEYPREVSQSPIFGEFDDELVAEVLARNVDAGTTRGEVVFIDKLREHAPVAALDVDRERLTPGSRDWINTHAEEHDIVVGFELPSGRITVDTFYEPDAGDWDTSRFNRFLESVGASPAALDDAVGRKAEIDLSTVEETQTNFREWGLGFLALVMTILLCHSIIVVGLGGFTTAVAVSAVIWTIVVSLLCVTAITNTDP